MINQKEGGRDGSSEGGKKGSINEQWERGREGPSDDSFFFSLNYRSDSLYIPQLLGLTLQR